jgi:hypothetical protein
MSYESERMQILEMIESGKITSVEGIKLLQALEEGSEVLPDEIPSESQPEVLLDEFNEQPPSSTSGGAETFESLENTTSSSLPPHSSANELPEAFSPPPGQGDRESQPGAMVHVEASSTDEEASFDEPAQGEIIPPPSIGPDMQRWKKLWQIPLWIGVVVTVLSSLLMYQAFLAGGFGFLFACTWFPFLLGVGVIALAWSSRNLPWLHLRIQQKPGEKPQRIAISMPLPLGLIRLGLRIFKGKIPNMGNVDLDEILRAMEHITPDAPLSVDVDEGDGEKVQIFIG